MGIRSESKRAEQEIQNGRGTRRRRGGKLGLVGRATHVGNK